MRKIFAFQKGTGVTHSHLFSVFPRNTHICRHLCLQFISLFDCVASVYSIIVELIKMLFAIGMQFMHLYAKKKKKQPYSILKHHNRLVVGWAYCFTSDVQYRQSQEVQSEQHIIEFEDCFNTKIQQSDLQYRQGFTMKLLL